VNRFDAWGWPHGTEFWQNGSLLVADLVSNAVLHGAARWGVEPYRPPASRSGIN
jgi:hypothetical protein